MKVLFVTPRFPYPPHKGDQVVAYRRMQTLSKIHDITLITFYENDEELMGLSVLYQYSSVIYTIKLTKMQSLINILFYSCFQYLPFQILYYKSKEFRIILRKITSENHFDIIHTFLLRMAEYTKKIDCPKVLELIDSMQLNFERRIQFEKGISRVIFMHELNRIKKYEHQIGQYFNHMILSADKDKKYFNDINISIVPNGVSLDEFVPKKREENLRTIIFSGNMNYYPNIQAVKWFIIKCFPLIQKKYPDVLFIIAGKRPPREIRKLEVSGKIIVTGFVESMCDCLNQASIAIVPMQSGSGIQNKILEAMACGLPVVTTKIGCGSIKATNKKEIFIADSVEEFVDTVCELLKNQQLANVIGNNARIFVEKYYNWDKSTELVDNIYQNLSKNM